MDGQIQFKSFFFAFSLVAHLGGVKSTSTLGCIARRCVAQQCRSKKSLERGTPTMLPDELCGTTYFGICHTGRDTWLWQLLIYSLPSHRDDRRKDPLRNTWAD